MVRQLMIVLSLLAFTIPVRGQVDVTHPEVASKIRLLDMWIDNQMIYRDYPGLSIAIVCDQQLIWSKGYGYSDIAKKAPTTPQTIYRIASVTKLFTSTAIMQLRDKGKLHLEDPVAKHLKWFKYKNRFPKGPVVTIKHLLTHTSGMPREGAFPYWTDYKFPTREQMIDALQNQESIFEPETKWKYSNLGMAILGEVVASVSGETFENYVQKNILTPLEMTDTRVHTSGAEKDRLAFGYGRKMKDGTRKVRPEANLNGISPAGSVTSSVIDLAKFASLQFRGGEAGGEQILKGSTLREMHRVHWVQPSWKSGWGLGFGVTKTDERVVVSHGGWLGGYKTQFSLSLTEKVAAIVMINSDDGSASLVANRALSLLAPTLAKLSKPKAPVTTFDPQWDTFVGKYADPSGWETEVLILDGALVLFDYNYPPDDNPSASVSELSPEGSNTFRRTGDGGNGELVIFEMDEAGKVFRVKVGENFIYPVE